MAKSPLDVRLYRSNVKGRRPQPGDMAYGDLAVNYNHDDPALIIKGDNNALIEFKPGAGVTVGAAAPASAKDGDLWWDTTSARLYLRYTSGTPAVTTWVDASPAAVPPTLANALTYKGTIDPTAASSAPASPKVGDTYVASKAGTVAAGWTGLAGSSVSLHELLVWDGAEWDGAGTAATPRTAWQGKIDPTVAKPAGYSAVAGDLIQLSKIGVAHANWPGVSQAANVGDIYLFDGALWRDVTAAPWARTGTVLTPTVSGDLVDPVCLPEATTAAKGTVRTADAAAITAGTAGRVVDAAQLKASQVWSRSGTTLSPATSGDLVAAAALPSASESAKGVVELATQAETAAGTDDVRAITPLKLSGVVSRGLTAPTVPARGQIWVDTTSDPPVLRVWDDTPAPGLWKTANAGVVSGATAPTSPARGDTWVDTSGTGDPALKIWTGTKWAASSGSSGTSVWTRTGTTLGPTTAGDLVAPAALPAATTAAQGAVRLATAADVTAGTAGRVVTADQLKTTNDAVTTAAGGGVPDAPNGTADGTRQFVRQVVSAGTVHTKSWVAASTAAASETAKGVVELATAAETTAGTDTTRAVHPAGLKVELDKKANLASPTFTGTPAAPTAAAGTNTTQLATTAFVHAANQWNRSGTTLSPATAGDVVSAAALPIATATALGGIKVGANLEIDASGVLKAKLASSLVFKGTKDPTGAAPATPATGDVYVMSTAGVLAAGWTGLVGTSVALHELVVWDGTEWVLMGSAVETTVHTVTGTAPLHAAGTTAVTLRVDDATAAAKGVVRLADAAAVTAGTAGRVVDAAQLKAHTPSDASTTAKGVVQLADAAAITAGTAGLVVDAAELKAAQYTLPTATAAALGGVKVGTNLSIDANGILSAKVAGALVFKGAKDPTVVLPAAPAPATGAVYVMNKAGVLAAGWTGLVGTGVSIHELVVFDGTEWVLMGSAVETTVHTITATAPLHAAGTTAVTMRVDDASATAKGVVQLATAAEVTAGTDTAKAVTSAGVKVELDKKAPLASPSLTGTPTAPTAAAGTNTTQLATTAFVHAAVAAEDLWDRTGTEITPKTAGDAVFTSGAVKVGGTTAAPNIQLNADGRICSPASVIGLKRSERFQAAGSYLAFGDGEGYRVINAGGMIGAAFIAGSGTNNSARLDLHANDFEVFSGGSIRQVFTHDGNLLLGGTLPASPRITLNATGLASFNGGGGVGDGRIAAVLDTVNPEAEILLRGLNSSRLKLRTFTAHGEAAKVTEVQFLDRNNADANDRLRGRIGAFNPNGGGTTGAYVQLIGGNGSDGNAVKVYESGVATFAQDVKIGGTLPASPSITLKADGQIVSRSHNNGDSLLVQCNSAPTGGTGPGISFEMINNGSVMKPLAFIKALMTGGAVGAERADLQFATAAAGTAPAEKARLTADGNFLLGGTLPASPAIKLAASGDGFFHSDNIAVSHDLSMDRYGIGTIRDVPFHVFTTSWAHPGAGVVLIGAATAWAPGTSESRLKDIQGDADTDQCWDLIRDIELKRYYYKDQADKTGVAYLGPMADWLGVQDPELLIDTGRTDEHGPIHTFNQGLLDMKALAALSAALKRIEDLETRLAALEPAAPHKQADPGVK